MILMEGNRFDIVGATEAELPQSQTLHVSQQYDLYMYHKNNDLHVGHIMDHICMHGASEGWLMKFLL